VLHWPGDPIHVKWPGAFTEAVPLSRAEALAFLAEPGRRRCQVCAPDIEEAR
jgi:hypothetical protein